MKIFSLPLAALLAAVPASAQGPVAVPAFDQVELRGGGEVTIRHGSSQQVRLVRGSLEVTGFSVDDDGRLRIDACMRSCRDYDLEIEIVTPDIDALAILKVDVLALGMLSCLRRAFELMDTHYGRQLKLVDLLGEEAGPDKSKKARVYAMIQRADTLGVFQIESRAQMSMLPRLKPRRFYDLVIEVAIVRPGPIQGNMVHPYLRRRAGEEE